MDEKKRCTTCVRGQYPCMYVSIARSSKTTLRQKAAHEILCGKCQCCSVHGQCMKVNNSGCMYWQPIPDTETENK